MKLNFRERKSKIFSHLVVLFASAIALALVLTNVHFKPNLFGIKADNNYQLVLDSSNAVSTAGDHIQKTEQGADVTFTYSNIASSSGNHTRLNENGVIVNKDIIHSIISFKVVYSGSGTLKARIAYVTSKWGEYFDFNSDQLVSTGTNPYFVEFKSFNGSVDISSILFNYSCSINQDAEAQNTSGKYEIEFNATGGSQDSSTELISDTIWNQVTSGDDYISSFSGVSKVFEGRYGLKFASNNYEGNLTINFDSSYVKNNITTVDVHTVQYGTKTSVFHVYINGSSSYTTITPSAGGSVSVNGKLTSLEIETSGKQAYLAGFTLNFGEMVEPGTPETPVFETGFSASDANSNKYTTNSTFALDNALTVYSVFSDGSHQSIFPGNNGYFYEITNSFDTVINPNEKFPAQGVYTLTVSYKNYIPVIITLNVGEYVYVTDVAASMSNRIFNTASILSEHLEGNLTATLEYSNGTSSSDIAYSEFASHGITAKLLTPKGITYNMSNMFGTAGTWTLKVYAIEDENMYFNISITVNAIPVQTITLNESSATLYPEDTLQLVASVNPTNATNTLVTWTSNNNEVATVDENGLVTALAVGGANITATAVDGSNVYGTCSITVVAKPQQSEFDAEMSAGTNASACTVNEIDGIKAGTSKNAGSILITIPSGATKVSFYSAGWNGSIGDVSMSISSGSISQSSYTPTANTGIANNSPFTLSSGSNIEDYKFEFNLSNISSEATITLSRSSRFVVWDAKYATTSTPITPAYPTAISLSGTNSITIGETLQLSVTYTPLDTNVKNVSYSSSNIGVATVSSSGLITGIAQGNATITATAEASNSTTVSTTFAISVNPVSVTSVSLDTNSATVKISKTLTLVAIVSPANATNKNVTWTSSNTSVATVNNSGVVTGVSAGTSVITVKTVDGNKTATCTVSVSASSEETFTISYTDLPTTYQTGSTVYTASSGIKFQAYNCANYSKKVQFKASSGYLQNTESLELQSITINDRESNTLTIYGSNTAGSFSTEINGSNDVYDLSGYNFFRIARTASGAAYCSSITIVTGTPTPTDPTSIIMNPTSAEVGVGGTKQLSVSYVPSNANQNKQVTWTSSNTNVATVNSEGLVSVKSTATAGQSAIITARLTNLTSIYATCTISVVEQQKDNHTVLIYMCGADLESENQLATGDIQEILKISGQPSDVNIVIETGGAKSWASTYGISSTNLERWHVSNKSLVKDGSLTYASMGLTSTLQSFIEYGLSNYPAERTGLVFWNHGGGMRGVCYDEKKNDDALKNSEIKSAVSGALSNCGMSGQKLEWVGYDACLMSVQDIAETNSQYFNYMISSEESEAGYGWDYDTWVDDLYSKKPTETILKAIVDGFIADNGGASSSSGDQTLSYLDLSYASAYKSAWESMAAQLNSKVTSSNRSSFNSAITGNVKHYGDSDYDYFCTFDAWDFVDKLANNSAFSSFKIDASYTTAVKNAHANLVKYSLAQKGAGVSKGLCMYWPNSTQYSDVSTYYTTSETNFTTWRSFCVNKGYHA